MSQSSSLLSLSLHDSATGEVKPAPVHDSVRFYACGITPYSSSHIGHGRSYVVFDLMVKLLRRSGKEVTFVRNITDIDDKIILEAEKKGVLWHELSHFYAEENRQLFSLMGLKEDVLEPKASDYLQKMFELISNLVEKGQAYISDTGDVLFDTSNEQGSFVTVDREKLQGGRVSSLGKKNDEDFVLWKTVKEGEVFFDSPFGRGRPGWHLECSSMIDDLLGSTIDYHGGGVDLKFPHHHAECLQSFAFRQQPLAKHWLHHGVIRDEFGQKMSKSLGNVVLLGDAISYAQSLMGNEELGGQLLRLTLLGTLWTKPMDFSFGLIDQMHERMKDISQALVLGGEETNDTNTHNPLLEVLYHNMNTPLFFTMAQQFAKQALKGDKKAQRWLLEGVGALGVPNEFLALFREEKTYSDDVLTLIELRERYRQEKNFEEADKIRDTLLEQGVDLKDQKIAQSKKTTPT